MVQTTCELALEQNTLLSPAIINLIKQLVEPVITLLSEAYAYLQLTLWPKKTGCKRYEMLCSEEEADA